MNEQIAVGRVGRPHGLDGSFVVEDASDDPDRFAPGSRLLLEGQPVQVVQAKRAGGRVVVRLDRDAVRGAVLTLPRSELPPPEEGTYYVADLVGLEVVEEGGRSLGLVTDVAPGVANDVLRLENGGLLPMVEECVVSVDLQGRRIVVAQGFADES